MRIGQDGPVSLLGPDVHGPDVRETQEERLVVRADPGFALTRDVGIARCLRQNSLPAFPEAPARKMRSFRKGRTPPPSERYTFIIGRADPRRDEGQETKEKSCSLFPQWRITP
jgi:hypothetical protein